PLIEAEHFAKLKTEPEVAIKVLQFSLWHLEQASDWRSGTLQAGLKQLAETMGVKIRDFLAPLFIAISGRSVAPPLFDSMVVLGPDLTRARVRHALNTLGGVSKKQAKKLEAEYRQLGSAS
ncbi:glutamate--tRNA ligase, partial [Pseudomonadales bacterium]|nr:glutamate--tRNA ligase [Pseudomonadales bacterium]